MSLIEEALDKAEKEKEHSAKIVPSRLSGIGSLAKNRDRRSPFGIVTAIVAGLCIVVSVGWLAYWWFQYRSQHHPKMISLNTEALPLSPEEENPSPSAAPPAASPPVSSSAEKSVPPSTGQASIKKGPPLKGIPVNAATPSAESFSPVVAKTPGKGTSSSKARKNSRAVKHIHPRHPHHKRQKRRAYQKKASPYIGSKKVSVSKKPVSLSVQLAREAIERGVSAYRSGDMNNAIREIETSLTYAEPTAQTLAFLGGIYLKLRDYDKAYAYLKRALSQAPSNPGILEKMGITLMARGEKTQAIPFFLRAIQAHPFMYTPHVNLGIAYWKSGNLRAARDQFLTAIKIRKDRPEAYYNLSGLYETAGDYSRALSSLESFMKRARGLDAPVREEAKTHIEALKAYLQKNGSGKNHD